MGYNRLRSPFSEVREKCFMDAMSLCGGRGCKCVLVLLQSVVIITAFPNLLTGDEISRLIDAGRINSDDARRIVEGQATPEELAQLKVAVLQLNSSSSNAALASLQPKGNLKLSESTACDVNPCRNGGVCSTPDVLNKDTTLCTCPRGYYGEFCDYDSPECEMEPCLNNGECQRSNALPRGYICICPTGFLGDNCEVTLRTDDTSTVKSAPLGVQKVTAQAQTVLFRPAAIIAFLCIIFFLLGMAFIATVEADRKVLTERYRVLISVGYRVDYPAIEFNRLAAIRIRFLCCCCCNMIPCCTCGVYQDDDDDDAIPLPPHMRDVDPCAQLRSIVQAASLNRTPSQPSLYGRAVMVEGDGGNRGYP